MFAVLTQNRQKPVGNIKILREKNNCLTGLYPCKFKNGNTYGDNYCKKSQCCV